MFFIDEYNSSGEEYRKEHYVEENERLIKLKHKIVSLEFLIDYRLGKDNFIFPEGYGRKATHTMTIPGQKKGFFSRLFGHRA